MARRTIVSCDAAGCKATTDQTDKAGSLAGWVRREVVDSCNKRMAEGMRDFGARMTQWLCPSHTDKAEKLPSPPLHPDVAAFLAQPETNLEP